MKSLTEILGEDTISDLGLDADDLKDKDKNIFFASIQGSDELKKYMDGEDLKVSKNFYGSKSALPSDRYAIQVSFEPDQKQIIYFDFDVAEKKYGDDWSIQDQLKRMGISQDLFVRRVPKEGTVIEVDQTPDSQTYDQAKRYIYKNIDFDELVYEIQKFHINRVSGDVNFIGTDEVDLETAYFSFRNMVEDNEQARVVESDGLRSVNLLQLLDKKVADANRSQQTPEEGVSFFKGFYSKHVDELYEIDGIQYENEDGGSVIQLFQGNQFDLLKWRDESGVWHDLEEFEDEEDEFLSRTSQKKGLDYAMKQIGLSTRKEYAKRVLNRLSKKLSLMDFVRDTRLDKWGEKELAELQNVLDILDKKEDEMNQDEQDEVLDDAIEQIDDEAEKEDDEESDEIDDDDLKKIDKAAEEGDEEEIKNLVDDFLDDL